MLERNDILEISSVPQGGDNEHQHAETAEGGSGENIDAPHGREPVVVEAHEPIHGGEGQRNSEKREAGEGDLAVQQGVTSGAAGILVDRVGAEPCRGDAEEKEIEGRTDPEEFLGEVGPLLIEEDVLAGEFGHPIPQLRSHKDQWDEEHTHYDQEAGHIFCLATDDYAPLRIDGVVDKRPEKPTHADREEEGEREEVGEGELLGVAEGAKTHGGKRDNGQCDEAEETTADMLVIKHVAAGLGWFVAAAHCFCASSWARSAGGTSLIAAPPCESWRARI